MTLITEPGTRHTEVNVDEKTSSILLPLNLMGLFVLSQFFSSKRPRRSANLVLKSCTKQCTDLSKNIDFTHHVRITDSGFKSKIFHVSEKCSGLNWSTKSHCFRCFKQRPPIEIRTAGLSAEWAAFAVTGFCLAGHWCFENGRLVTVTRYFDVDGVSRARQ